ncbi:YbaN family protein [soil metagenome]
MVLGLICVGLGIIGAVLPLMPTTIFLILAAGCFARSSPRLEKWLLDHPRFGPTLRNWRAEGAISKPGKIAACSGIGVGYLLFFTGAHPGWRVAVPVAILMAGFAVYIVSRPAPRA